MLLTGPKIPLSNKSKFWFDLEIKDLECGGRVQETRVEDDSSLSLNCPQSDYLRCLQMAGRLPGSCRASSCWRALWKYPFLFSCSPLYLPIVTKLLPNGLLLLCLIGSQLAWPEPHSFRPYTPQILYSDWILENQIRQDDLTLHSKQKRQTKKGISEGWRQLYRDAASWNDTDILQLGKEQKEQRELWRKKKSKIRFDHVADNGIFSCPSWSVCFR